MELPQAFYLPVADGTYESTVATASPWDEGLQHGGPPSALLVHAISARHPRPDAAVGRVSLDFFGPIPQGRMTVATQVIRPGRRIELLEASLSVDGRVVVVARVWRTEIGRDAAPVFDAPLPTGYELPADPQPQRFPEDIDPEWGYGRAVEYRFVSGAFHRPGPVVVWTRPRVPLVDGQPMSGLERALIVADSANGLSAELGFADWLFIPPALTVTVFREPAGEWVLLDARTTIAERGTGLAHATLFDGAGEFGVASQPLLVQSRGPS